MIQRGKKFGNKSVSVYNKSISEMTFEMRSPAREEALYIEISCQSDSVHINYCYYTIKLK